MKKRVFLEKEYGYTIDDKLDIYFCYGNSVIFTTGKKTKVGNEHGVQTACILKVISFYDIEEFYAVIEANRYLKSEIISIQGIISFLTGIPLIEYCGFSQKTSENEIKIEKRGTVFKIGTQDYTQDLLLLLDKISNDKDTIISLLDRWRKSNYLVQESIDANLYHDEAILSYFHIIELLSEIYKKDLKETLDSSIGILLNNYFNQSLTYSAKQTVEKVTKNKSVLSELLVENEMTVAQKSKYFLKQVGMFDEITSNFLDDLIATRNSIAHGRKTYRNNVLWPVPPFFCLAHSSYESIPPLNMLTARMISKYVGLTCWEDEWNDAKQYLMPAKDTFNDFLKNPNHYECVTVHSLCDGNIYNITWYTIFNYHVQDSRKFNLLRIENATKQFFLSTPINANTCNIMFNISVILCDSEDTNISEKAKNIVSTSIQEGWHQWSNKKDIFGYLEYNNISLAWYNKFLAGRV